MASPHLMSLDAGGGGGHCLLVDVESGRCTRALRSWTHPAAAGTAGLGTDLDLRNVWAKLGEAAREAIERAGIPASAVAGIAVTSMRHTTVLLDAHGEALLAAPNRDARAALEAMRIAGESGEQLYRRTGRWPLAVASAARLCWLAAAQPERWARAATAHSLSDWIAYRLCGELATDPSQANETLLLDVVERRWAPDLAERLGIPARLLPPLREPGERLGGLTPEAAAALGLAAGTPVAVGGADTQCGLLGAGAFAPSHAAVIAGTTVPVQQVLDRPAIDPEGRLWTCCHLMAGRWVLESNAGPMGEAIDWLAQLLLPDSPMAVARFLAEAALSQPGARGILSTFGAEVMNAREARLPLGGLTLSHLGSAGDPRRRAHLARAVVEGMACALRANLEQLASVSGAVPQRLRLAGGLARSDAFAQVLSDVLGQPIERGSTAEATGLGAAICAGVGAGLFPDLVAGARHLATEARVSHPDTSRADAYRELYGAWMQSFTARAPADAIARQVALPAVLQRMAEAPPAAASEVPLRILVTADMDDRSLEALRALGQVEYASFRERMRLLTGDDLVAALAGVQVFVTEVDVLDAAALRRLPDLRVVASCRGDAVNVDTAACTACGIPVLNAPGRNAEAVADLTVAFLLMLSRKLPGATAFLRQGDIEAGDIGRMGQAFQGLRGHELWRRTVGLVGLGAVGRAVARRLAPFGVRLLGHDPKLSEEQVILAGAAPASLDELLERSDFVSLHAAVTPETHGMIGAAELARMKPGACLVNTARAALVDEVALAEALRSQHLGGAALDVFRDEPPGADDPLLALDQLIATPHVGGNTVEVAAHQGEIVVAELERLLRGQPPLHALNPEALAGFDWHVPRRPLDDALLARMAARPGPAVSDLQRNRRTERRATTPPATGAATGAPTAARPVAPPAEIVERMTRIASGFLDRVSHDPALHRLAEGKDVTLRFTLPDLGLRLYLRLRDGRASGGLDDPDGQVDVELKMRAEVFDGMFTGTVNAMHAATTGHLSFAGDTVKAMTLQQAQADLERIYRQVRDEAGGPGDLASVPDPSRAGRTGGPAAEAAPVTPGDVREELVAVVDELYRSEMITATGGNVSVRIPGRDEIWITPGQLFKGHLRPEMLVRLDLDGNPLDEGALSPSSERMMHCAVYRTRPDAHAVVHAHAPYATILVDAELPFLPISTEAAFFGDIPRVPFIMPGTDELARAVGVAAKDSWAVLLQNHGLIVGGRSLRRAADMVEIIDRTAQTILGCYAVQRTPPTLPAEIVAALQRMGDLMA